MRFFKRAAPNNMKKEDLIAKSRIITDPLSTPGHPALFPLIFGVDFVGMRKPALILYSQQLYGERLS
jgi:hypothetical protein